MSSDHNTPQKKVFFRTCYEVTTTASHLEVITGIHQKNICRYKRELEKLGLLREVEKVKCPITNKWAWTLTTDPAKFPPDPQLKLWE